MGAVAAGFLIDTTRLNPLMRRSAEVTRSADTILNVENENLLNPEKTTIVPAHETRTAENTDVQINAGQNPEIPSGGPGHRINILVPLRWSDMDAYGHINNVQIARILEEARITAFGTPRGTGVPGVQPHVSLFDDLPDGTLALVVEQKIRYVRTLDYRNIPAIVQLWIGGVKGASFDIHYVVKDPITRHTCVHASSRLAFVDEDKGGLQRLTPEQKERIAPYIA